MATVTVDSTLGRAAVLLQDPTNIRWPLPELLNWLNDGQREVVLRKPNASVRNAPLVMVAGTKQSIPADGVQLLDVVRNLPGSAIRIVDREILDAQLPDWHIATASSQVTPTSGRSPPTLADFPSSTVPRHLAALVRRS